MPGPTFSGRKGDTLLRRAIRLTAVTIVLTAAGACSEPAGVAQDDPEEALLLENGAIVRIPLEPGLEQTLQLEPKRLHPGDNLRVRSVVRNVSKVYKKAEALVCQLEIRTNMDFQSNSPLILCFAYSVTVRLAPNDSLVLTASGTVKSPPGRYIMVVRHLLRPDLRARVRVNVYPRLTDAITATAG